MTGMQTPSIAEVIRLALVAGFADLRVSMPGRVESYNSAKQTANVFPLLRANEAASDGSTSSISRPVINNVPVLFPQGGGFQLKLPVTKGDIVLLVFCDRSLDIWKSKGGEVDPIDLRQHHISDAVAIAGMFDPAAAAPTAAIEIKPDGTILVGAGAAHPAVLGDAFQTHVLQLSTALNALQAAITPLMLPPAAAAAKAALVAAKAATDALANDISTVVKNA
jgi:hypothetical protein